MRDERIRYPGELALDSRVLCLAARAAPKEFHPVTRDGKT